MGRYRLRAAGGRSEAEGQFRHRGRQALGGGPPGKHACRAVAQCRGFWQGAFRRSRALSGTGPEDAAARGACRGSARNRLEKRDLARNELARNEFARNELEKASDRGAQTGRSKLRHACRRLAREIRAAMAYSYQAVTAPAGRRGNGRSISLAATINSA